MVLESLFPALTSRDQFGCTSPFVPEHLRQGLEICANATLGAKVNSDDEDDNDDNDIYDGRSINT